ncbi:MAG: YdeI/OmpD-associated family protein [Microbacteriaceae bacterium]
MSVTYSTLVIPDGNHASITIPDDVLVELGANRRAALRITINGHTYESTATAVNGECRVVFPSANRVASGAAGGDTVNVTLELITGYREVELHPEFIAALGAAGLRTEFDELAYSHRKEYARAIAEAKADDTRHRRIVAAIDKIRLRVSGS